MDLKPVGAFIEHTIRPLIGEARWFLDKFEELNIPISKDTINLIYKTLSKLYIISLLGDLLRTIIVSIMICILIYLIIFK